MSAAWTDDELRAATPFPKPQGAFDQFWDTGGGTEDDAEPEPLTPERRLLEHVLENGDYLKTEDSELCPTGTWLLIPLTWSLVDMLEQFQSERADLEGDHDREDEHASDENADDEPDADSEPNGDDEPNTGDDEPELYDGGQNGGYPLPPDPRALGPIPVYASVEGQPRARREFPPGPTHPVLGKYRRLY